MNRTYDWYLHLIKPKWAPPSWLFGPVWAVLYVLIAVSFSNVFLLVWQNQVSDAILLPFILNLVFNFSFMPLQFRLKNNFLATADILLVLGTLLWLITAIYPYSHWTAYAQVPYLLWVLFATILQLAVTYLN